MGTELRQIRLRNWKCFRDQTVTFQPADSRHIWILFGSNGAGKTSLLDAVRWCLYGGDAITPAELLSHFHRQAVEQDPSVSLEVALEFGRDGKTIQLSRMAKRVPRGTTAAATVNEVTLFVDGVQQSDPRNYIATFLPRECSQFFFFDGVDIKKYAMAVHKPEIKDAIERVLGIPELRNLRDDAEEALRQLEEQLRANAAGDKELTRVEGELLDARDELSALTEQIAESEKLRDAAKELFESTRERVKQLEGLKGKMREVTRLEREVTTLKDQLNDLEEQLEGLVRDGPTLLLLEDVRTVATELQSATLSTQRRAGAQTQLERLLSAVKCLCGRDMTPDTIEFIRKELENIRTAGVPSKEALELDNVRRDLDRVAQTPQVDFTALLKKRDRFMEQSDTAQTALASLKEETGGIDVEEERLTWRRLEEAEKALGERKSHFETLLRARDEKENEVNEKLRDRERLVLVSAVLKKLQQQTRIARGLRDAAADLITWRIAERKERIEALTTSFYRRVTNKPDEYDGVEIGENYALTVRTRRGTLVNTETLSAGEKEALAYSFITALNVASGNAGLFVMDTPFGHLDSQHQKNLVQSLTAITHQVIVLATDRDFPEAMLALVSPQVAQKLEIRRLGVAEDASSVEVLG